MNTGLVTVIDARRGLFDLDIRCDGQRCLLVVCSRPWDRAFGPFGEIA
jgi:hypothetical protein